MKIDRSFIARLDESECIAIIRAVTGMCRDLGMQTVAEGVETTEQLECLQRLRCTEVQGFLFSGPVPGNQVPALLSSRSVQAAYSYPWAMQLSSG